MMNRDFPDEKQFRAFTPLVSLHGESDLSSVISNYSDEVWFREMMQLMMMMVMLMI
jgi:succinate dehydrogenase hydrophobic anchor subunit